MMISARQLTAARALLGVTQEQLAEAASTSPTTINKFEKGDSISFDKLRSIRAVLEGKGIEFIGKEGVLRRSGSVRTYEGASGGELFYDDILSTIKTKGGVIAASFDTQESLAYAFGVTNHAFTGRLEKLSQFADVRCLLFNANASSAFIPSFRFRAIERSTLQPFFHIVYGDKVAVVIIDSMETTYIVIQSVAKAQRNMESFEADWNRAFPFSYATTSSLAV